MKKIILSGFLSLMAMTGLTSVAEANPCSISGSLDFAYMGAIETCAASPSGLYGVTAVGGSGVTPGSTSMVGATSSGDISLGSGEVVSIIVGQGSGSVATPLIGGGGASSLRNTSVTTGDKTGDKTGYDGLGYGGEGHLAIMYPPTPASGVDGGDSALFTIVSMVVVAVVLYMMVVAAAVVVVMVLAAADHYINRDRLHRLC